VEESGKLGEGKVAYCAVEVEEKGFCMASFVVVAVESGKPAEASLAVEVGEMSTCRVCFWVVVEGSGVELEGTCAVVVTEESGGVEDEGVVEWDGDRASWKKVVEERHGFLKFQMGD